MPGTAKVSFARVNRRNPDQLTFDRRPFAVDMQALADSGRLRAGRGTRTYIAGDLQTVDQGAYMIGVLGYQVTEEVRSFAEEGMSWIKGQTTVTEGALRDTTVPFAVDMRSDRRWVAFAPSARIQPSGFAAVFREVLNAAVRELDLWPSDWDVDLVTSPSTIRAWVEAHPRVFKLSRVVRTTNPGVDLSDERARMAALRARTKKEEYTAGYAQDLKVSDNPAFEEAIEGVEQGDVDIRMTARGDGRNVTFSSTKRHDESSVEAFDGDLVRGMELVLTALKGYSAGRSGDPSG